MMRKSYGLGQAALVIVGDVTREKAESLVASLQATLPQVAPWQETLPLHNKPKTIEKYFDSTQTAVMMGMRLDLSPKDDDYYPLIVGNEILGAGSNGLSSHLANEVREKRGLVYSIVSDIETSPGLFSVSFRSQNDRVEEAVGVTRETLANFVAGHFNQEELERSKQAMQKRLLVALATNKAQSSVLASLWTKDLDAAWVNERSQKIRAVTLEQVQEAFARRLQLSEMTIVKVGGNVQEATQ